jgi:hypothetical protein
MTDSASGISAASSATVRTSAMVQSDVRTVPIPGQLMQHEDGHLGQLGGGLDERGARG